MLGKNGAGNLKQKQEKPGNDQGNDLGNEMNGKSVPFDRRNTVRTDQDLMGSSRHVQLQDAGS